MSQAFRRSRFTPTPAGGTIELGVIKFSSLSQLFSNLVNGGIGSGKLSQTVAIGQMTNDVALLAWTANMTLRVTSFGLANTFTLYILLRDATVEPSVSDAQFALAAQNAGAAAVSIGVAVAAIGNTAVDGNIISKTAFVQQFNPLIAGGLDNYGNAIKKGDNMVLDFGIQSSHPSAGSNGGTYDIIAWVSALFS